MYWANFLNLTKLLSRNLQKRNPTKDHENQFSAEGINTKRQWKRDRQILQVKTPTQEGGDEGIGLSC